MTGGAAERRSTALSLNSGERGGSLESRLRMRASCTGRPVVESRVCKTYRHAMEVIRDEHGALGLDVHAWELLSARIMC